MEVMRRTSSLCIRRVVLRIYKSLCVCMLFIKNWKVEFMFCGSVDKRFDFVDCMD